MGETNPVVVRFLSPAECYDLIFQGWKEERNAQIDTQRHRALEEQPRRVVLRVPEPLSAAGLRARDRMLTVLETALRDVPFETGEGGVLSLPSHEPCGFERARGVLAAEVCAAEIPVISCGVKGHAPDCECATL